MRATSDVKRRGGWFRYSRDRGYRCTPVGYNRLNAMSLNPKRSPRFFQNPADDRKGVIGEACRDKGRQIQPEIASNFATASSRDSFRSPRICTVEIGKVYAKKRSSIAVRQDGARYEA